jgi:hypothetical protein
MMLPDFPITPRPSRRGRGSDTSLSHSGTDPPAASAPEPTHHDVGGAARDSPPGSCGCTVASSYPPSPNHSPGVHSSSSS